MNDIKFPLCITLQAIHYPERLSRYQVCDLYYILDFIHYVRNNISKYINVLMANTN